MIRDVSQAQPKVATNSPAEKVPPATPPAAPTLPVRNPSLRLAPELGLVVIEFRDSGGQVTQSIPSERELDAYRSTEKPTEPPAHDVSITG